MNRPFPNLVRLARLGLVLAASLLAAGCTTSAVLMHIHAKATEGAPPSCGALNTVQRALQARCGEYRPGSLDARDVAAPDLPRCPLALAAREPRLWAVLPELVAKGASPEACNESPLAALAVADGCPDFGAASPESLAALRWLAEADARALQHDVIRLLSCPSARVAGLATVLDVWLAAGALAPRALPFSPLAALHPSYLDSPFTQALEVGGHQARDAHGAYPGRLPTSFELALRSGDFAAVDWWLSRAPALLHTVPPARGQQLPWVPLARALTPAFLPDAAQRERTVAYLLARGADPWQRLPHDPSQTVLAFARSVRSPELPLLEAPPRAVSMAVARRP